MKNLTEKQILKMEKAQSMIVKAIALIKEVESNSDLKKTHNLSLHRKAQMLNEDITDEIATLYLA